jgi:hypothetical protein
LVPIVKSDIDRNPDPDVKGRGSDSHFIGIPFDPGIETGRDIALATGERGSSIGTVKPFRQRSTS